MPECIGNVKLACLMLRARFLRLDRAGRGDETAWNDIVDRFTNLLWSVCRSFRLADDQAFDVVQTGDERSASRCNRSIARRRRSLLRFRMQHNKPPLVRREIAEIVPGIVGRAVIDYDDLDVFVGLPQNGGHCSL